MSPVKPIGIRSSLFSHSFPSFYACYLLKSVRTPQSTSTYIGSTPSPPRRIRQHNGELTQGARKTRLKRPWVMQMLVHGFPSKLAALQFEWAWQNPHLSRHLRDADGRIFATRGLTVKKNILIVRTMIAKHPFNTWPLHIKFFTEEAVQNWNATSSSNVAFPLPPGLTVGVELEGVDGKSGHPGSGRQGPIIVTDEEFTSAYLAKNTALIAAGGNLECTICCESVDSYAANPLTTTLCPASSCTAVSHLICLSQHFVSQESGATQILPRGGQCKSCNNYTLWGDVVRGCYRRVPPTKNVHQDVATDDMFTTDNEDLDMLPTPKRKSRNQSSSPSIKRRKLTKGKRNHKHAISTPSSEGETFDFNNIVSSSESEEVDNSPVKRNPGRLKKGLSGVGEDLVTPKRKTTRTKSPSSSAKIRKLSKQKEIQRPVLPVLSDEGESFDFSGIASSSESDDVSTSLVRRKPGRPRKALPGVMDRPTTSKRAVSRKVGASSSTPGCGASKGKEREDIAKSSMSQEGEIFDISNISSGSGRNEGLLTTPVKAIRGRPRKVVEMASSSSILPANPHTLKELVSPKTKVSRIKSLSPPIGGRIPSKAKQKHKAAKSSPPSSGDEIFDFSNITSGGESENFPTTPTKRKVGRPRKNVEFVSPGITTPNRSTREHKSPKHKSVPAASRHYHDWTSAGRSNGSSSGESYDFGGIRDTEDRDEDTFARDGRCVRPLASFVETYPVKPPNLRFIGTRDTPAEQGLIRSMSTLSVSTPNDSPWDDRDMTLEVIEISD
ncbi:hypothetical protein B0H34DRAFT_358137 [Crassisporium funariophilum]|nr:hypothetical protein B0H34DRAFT_358137 [Crassisporium funariophilum]